MSDNIQLFTSKIELVETSDDSLVKPKLVKIKIPIINQGQNKKHLKWVPETMKKIASMFRGVPFRYDLKGENEGSHVREHISSPFYDVGWTYSDDRGAYYDPVKKCIYVQGEVTHPDVIEKLMRKTSEGKREINYASMGAVMTPQQTKCSICGKSPFGSCNHTRGEKYGNDIAAMVPTDISKALHVALTNDPADKVAEIEQAIFQDMSDSNELADSTEARSEVAAPVLNLPRGQEIDEIVAMVLAKLEEAKSLPTEEDSKMKKAKLNKDESGKGAIELSQEDDTLDKPIGGNKKSDKEFDKKDLKKGTKEEGEHTTDKKVAKGIAKDHLTEDKDAYDEDDKKSKKKKVVTADDDEDEDDSEDVKKAKKASKGKKESKELPDMKEMADDSEFKISGATGTKPVIETSDTAIKITGKVEKTKEVIETADNVYEEKYRTMLIKELADQYVALGKSTDTKNANSALAEKSTKELEIYQDAYIGIIGTSAGTTVQEKTKSKSIIPKYKDVVKPSENNTSDIVPQHGGTVGGRGQVYAFQDMSPRDRTEKYGGYGSFELCFHPENAHKYKTKK